MVQCQKSMEKFDQADGNVGEWSTVRNQWKSLGMLLGKSENRPVAKSMEKFRQRDGNVDKQMGISVNNPVSEPTLNFRQVDSHVGKNPVLFVF
ncbi:hypothetical protein PPYR_09407 [Photinus pyralis]|uniref:Uncharacterized protein n=1 Tax=Photinus pyralis TaxID=7054 RepID=A0A5N4AM77_PHOPY|nr:hypothetical protein PPYR_09407 [Photinus pyralis]